MLVEAYHRRARIRPPNRRLHAVFHVIVENQIALGDELPVRDTVRRLMAEGLDRHEAIHAVGMVLSEHIVDLMHVDGSDTEWNQDAYDAALARLPAESWLRSSEDEPS